MPTIGLVDEELARFRLTGISNHLIVERRQLARLGFGEQLEKCLSEIVGGFLVRTDGAVDQDEPAGFRIPNRQRYRHELHDHAEKAVLALKLLLRLDG